MRTGGRLTSAALLLLVGVACSAQRPSQPAAQQATTGAETPGSAEAAQATPEETRRLAQRKAAAAYYERVMQSAHRRGVQVIWVNPPAGSGLDDLASKNLRDGLR